MLNNSEQIWGSNHLYLLTSELSVVKVCNQQMVQSENCLQYQKWRLYKVKEAFSKSIERRNDPPRQDQGLSTALHNSHHVHAMVPVHKLAHLPYVPHSENLSPKCIPPPINRSKSICVKKKLMT